MIGIDTNVLLRYLTQDDARQSALAARFIDRQLTTADPGHVSLVVLAELLWVLATRFRASRAEMIAVVTELLSDPRFAVQDERAVWLAVELAEKVVIDLPEALIAFVNRTHGCERTVTFDVGASRIPGMTLLT